jgi:hypothetical protein
LDGKKIVHVDYFDPARVEDWATNAQASADFPAQIRVSVDIGTARAISDNSTPPEL